MNRIVMRTAAASDARMGSQPAGHEQLWQRQPGHRRHHPGGGHRRALRCQRRATGPRPHHEPPGAIYIKSHYPPLSAFCGNTVTSAAAAMAMVYLAGGSFEQSCHAIQNVLSDSAGMVCDGAKASCAMKVSTSSGAAVRGFLMALNSHGVSGQGSWRATWSRPFATWARWSKTACLPQTAPLLISCPPECPCRLPPLPGSAALYKVSM